MKKICFGLALLNLCLIGIANAVANAGESATLTKNQSTNPLIINKAVDCSAGTPCFIIKNSATQLSLAVNQSLSPALSVSLIEKSIVPQINFSLMTRLAVGRSWSESATINAAQKEQITNLFKQLLIFQYSISLSKFQGAQITIDSSLINKDNPNKAAVRGTFKLPSNGNSNTQAIRIEYGLAKINNLWKVYDVKIENVSIVATFRSQFDDIIKNKGAAELIKQLQAKVNNLKST